MNAPLRSDAVAIPLLPATTVFRVRKRTPLAFDIVVEMDGPAVLRTDEPARVVASMLYGEATANAAAEALVEQFRAEHPERPVTVRLAPVAGRRVAGATPAAVRFIAAVTMRRPDELVSPDDPVRVEQAERHLAFLRSLP